MLQLKWPYSKCVFRSLKGWLSFCLNVFCWLSSEFFFQTSWRLRNQMSFGRTLLSLLSFSVGWNIGCSIARSLRHSSAFQKRPSCVQKWAVAPHSLTSLRSTLLPGKVKNETNSKNGVKNINKSSSAIRFVQLRSSASGPLLSYTPKHTLKDGWAKQLFRSCKLWNHLKLH